MKRIYQHRRKPMTSLNRYLTSRDGYGSTSTGAAGEIFWDADPTHAAPNALYRVLDVLCPDDAHALHEEIGDANLYMLTVLRQLYAEGVASTFAHGSRDGDTQYRSASWDKMSIVSEEMSSATER
jgi:hypothetical protein